MKTSMVMAIAATVWSVSAISAERYVETKQGIYHLTGNRVAVGVCEAVIKDNPGMLKRTLRRHKSIAVLMLPAKDYSCNGDNLMAYAEDMGSDAVAQYLQRYNWREGQIKVDQVAQVEFIAHQ